jgi:regulator of protease activity HflC (stomatin/prohibitin superfamily)
MDENIFSEKFNKMKKNQKFLPVIVGIFVLIIILFKSITIVPAGHVGVKDLFGSVADDSLKAGIHLVNPLVHVISMSIQTQELTEKASVPSKEGLVVDLEASLLFSLDPGKAPQVYRSIGANYRNVVVVPQIRSVIRGITAEYEAKALYTSKREILTTKMIENLKPQLAARGINVENILLRSIKLPDIVATAIEKKLEAEQQSEQMKFVLQRETQEAERKRVEARGIADFQAIVSKGLSEGLLKWKGIEATKDLAESNNAKIVVIGSGKDGLPLILGQ